MHVLETLAAVGKVSKTGVSTLPDPSIGGSLMKMVVAIVVLGACALIIKRRAAGRNLGQSFFRPNTASTKTRTGLRVISRQALGKGACLAVVEWEGREVLVGITNAGISFYEEQTALGTSTETSLGTTESTPVDASPFPSDAMDLLTKRTRSSILDPLRELTVRR